VGFSGGRRRKAPQATEACRGFVEALRGAGALASAEIVDGAAAAQPIRAYPLRVDFPASPVWADGVLFAGEAAGLVNPLTGEGIDYALESGRIAADTAAAFLANGDDTARGFAAAASTYEGALRRRFQRLFAACRMIREASSRPAVLNRLVRIAGRREDLTAALVNIVLGNREPMTAASVRSALGRVLLAR
jgi:flavin-dependent dehydrogenase